MAIVVSCVNLKGGVGKTTIAVNFAAYCGIKGFKVLLIDLDPQTNATFSCMSGPDWDKHAKKHGTVANLLDVRATKADKTPVDPKKVLVKNVFKNVDLIPSHLDMFTIDLEIAGQTARERILKKALTPLQKDYDVMVCDCPPNLTIPTQNALACSDFFVVPVTPDYLSSLGISLLLSRIDKFCDDIDSDKKAECAGIVLSKVGRMSGFRETIIDVLRTQFGKLVYNTMLTDFTEVSKVTQELKSIFEGSNRAAIDQFNTICGEIANRIGLKK